MPSLDSVVKQYFSHTTSVNRFQISQRRPINHHRPTHLNKHFNYCWPTRTTMRCSDLRYFTRPFHFSSRYVLNNRIHTLISMQLSVLLRPARPKHEDEATVNDLSQMAISQSTTISSSFNCYKNQYFTYQLN
jgi:hypothetical protein